MSRNKRIAVALYFPTVDKKFKSKEIKKINDFLLSFKSLLSSNNYNFDDVADLLTQSNINIITWIMKPPTCNKSGHKNCTLYNCFNKCYNSIVPNGACGYILEYVINERHKLPVESRDDLYINVYSKDFLSNFYNHVNRNLHDSNWDIENSLKYKYEGMFNWFNENRRSNNFYSFQTMYPLDFWFDQESWKELKNLNGFIIFVDKMDTLPYISE